MPDDFGIDLFDAHSPPPSHAALVLLETHAGQNYEHLIETALATHTTVYINPLTPPDQLTSRIRDTDAEIEPDDIYAFTSFSELLDATPDRDRLTAVDLVVFENANELSQFGPDLIEAGIRFMDLMDDAYLLCHLNLRPDHNHTPVADIRERSDVIAQITTSLHGEQFQLTTNTLGAPMDTPVALTTPREAPTDTAAADTGNTPFGFDVSLGGTDQPVATAPDQLPSGDPPNTTDRTGESTTADASMSLIETPDDPDTRRDPTPDDSPVRDGNARGQALLDEYDVRTTFDVESLKWRQLMQLAGALDVAVHGGDRDTYERQIKPLVDEILNGDRSVDTLDAHMAAIEEPRDVTALEWEYLVYTAESLGVTPDKDTRPAYEQAVVTDLFDDATLETPHHQSTPFNLIEPDIDDDWLS
jgi:hypothetical protein